MRATAVGVGVALLVTAAGPPAAAADAAVVGVVTAGGAPVANAWVQVTPVTERGDWSGAGSLGATDDQGRFAVTGLAPGSVKVRVRPPALSPWAATWWPRAYTFADAGTLAVRSGAARADIDLPEGGRVTGTVVSTSSGEPVDGARVTAHVATPAGTEQVGDAGLAPGPGQFEIRALPPVPVLLQAEPPPGTNLLPQWFPDAGFAGAATPVDGSARTEGLRVGLPLGAEVSGTVRDDAGAPVAGARVVLTFCPGLCPLAATTEQDGSYRIGSIPPGPRQVLHASAAGTGLLEGWHRVAGQSWEARLDLRPGDVRTGVDITLVRGAFLTVRVVDDGTDAPVTGVSAELESLSNPILGFLPRSRDRLVVRSGSSMLERRPSAEQSASPDPAGSEGSGGSDPMAGPAGEFVIGPVPPGEYRLVLYPGYDNARYLPTTWGRPTGTTRSGEVSLAPGQRALAVVPLVASGPEELAASDERRATDVDPASEPPGAGGCGGGPDGRGQSAVPGPAGGSQPEWPGLSGGVLGPAPAWLAAA